MSDWQRDGEECDQYVPTPELARFMHTNSIYQDLQNLSGSGENVVPVWDRARAQQLVENHEFLRWLAGQGPPHILVHGGYREASRISGLSLFSRSLFRVLDRRGPRFIPLAFFCGMQTRHPAHVPPSYNETQWWSRDDIAPPGCNDDFEPPYYNRVELPFQRPRSGGHALIRSFIGQLLRHYPLPRVPVRARELREIDRGNLEILCGLFSRIVSMLPRHFTVWCLVDGAEYYEEYGAWYGARQVLEQLVQLSNPYNRGASVRLLITTPTYMADVMNWFERPLSLPVGETRWGNLVMSNEILEQRLDRAIAGRRRHQDSSVPQNRMHLLAGNSWVEIPGGR